MEIGEHHSFDKVTKGPRTLYLSLLNITSNAAETLDLLEEAMASSPEQDMELVTLFREGWRHELVAGTAMLLCGATPATLEALWKALDEGSWVSPQLAVIVSLTDPDFVPRARKRLLLGCPIVQGARHAMSAIEVHVIHGPEGDRARSAKNFGALMQRLWQLPEEREWLLSRFTLAELLRILFLNATGQDYAREWACSIGKLRPKVPSPLEKDLAELLAPWLTSSAIGESGLPGHVLRSLLGYNDQRTALVWLLEGKDRVKLQLERGGSLILGEKQIPEPFGWKLFSRYADYPPQRLARFIVKDLSLTVERHPRIMVNRERLPAVDADMIAYGAKDTGEMGGGAANAILMAAGPGVQRAFREGLAREGRRVGTAIVTRAFRLEQSGPLWISHIVSIIKKTSQGSWCPEPERLGSGVRTTLEDAEKLGLSRVAFASLGTGEGRVPPGQAARIMIDAVRRYFQAHQESLLQVRFCLPTERDYNAFEKYRRAMKS